MTNIVESFAKGKRRFVILPAGQLPEGALTWEGATERREALRRLRRAIMHKFGKQGRVLRVAWILCDLIGPRLAYSAPRFRCDEMVEK